MSDEQTMPEVIYAGILDASEMSSPFNSSDKPYLRCPDNIDPDDAVVVSKQLCEDIGDDQRDTESTIATLTAEREKVRELVKAVEAMYLSDSPAIAAERHDVVVALAAQLKEQDNEA